MHDRRGHHRVPVSSRVAFALGVGIVALLAACDPAPTSSPTGPVASGGSSATPTPVATQGAVETPPPTPSPLPPSVAAPCTAADLKASHGAIEGAAGSRFTEVVLVSAIACAIDLYPSLGLRDANGAALIGGIPSGSGRLDLVAGTGYVSAVRLANWCRDDSPTYPIVLEVRLGAEAVPVTGDSFPAEGETPPCNGEGVPPSLEGGPWTAQ